MLVLYFRNEMAIFKEQRLALQLILDKHLDCSKAKFVKNDKSKANFYSQSSKFHVIQCPHFLKFASMLRYWRFVIFASVNAWLISPLIQICVPRSWLYHFFIKRTNILRTYCVSRGAWFSGSGPVSS